jgi:hypothetical protein
LLDAAWRKTLTAAVKNVLRPFCEKVPFDSLSYMVDGLGADATAKQLGSQVFQGVIHSPLNTDESPLV